MNHNKNILEHCPNFYNITNFDFNEDDYISAKLISIYEDYIFNINIASEEEIKKAEQIDKVLIRYIEDYQFRKEMKYKLSEIRVKKNAENIIKIIIDNIIHIFNIYEEGTTRRIYVTKWI